MLEIKVPAEIDHLDNVLDFVNAAIDDLNADLKFSNNINIAVEEIFVNIAHYAYPEGDGDVIVSVLISDNNVTIEFTDSGIPYNPLEKADPDTTLSADERSIGGLGIFMVKKLMDTMSYRYDNNKNILSMTKQWSANV